VTLLHHVTGHGLRKLLMKKLEGTEIAQLLEEFHLLSR
jgi:oleate hydratase